jgi:hypothetical protein
MCTVECTSFDFYNFWRGEKSTSTWHKWIASCVFLSLRVSRCVSCTIAVECVRRMKNEFLRQKSKVSWSERNKFEKKRTFYYSFNDCWYLLEFWQAIIRIYAVRNLLSRFHFDIYCVDNFLILLISFWYFYLPRVLPLWCCRLGSAQWIKSFVIWQIYCANVYFISF